MDTSFPNYGLWTSTLGSDWALYAAHWFLICNPCFSLCQPEKGFDTRPALCTGKINGSPKPPAYPLCLNWRERRLVIPTQLGTVRLFLFWEHFAAGERAAGTYCWIPASWKLQPHSSLLCCSLAQLPVPASLPALIAGEDTPPPGSLPPTCQSWQRQIGEKRKMHEMKRDEKEKRLARRITALSAAGVKYSILALCTSGMVYHLWLVAIESQKTKRPISELSSCWQSWSCPQPLAGFRHTNRHRNLTAKIPGPWSSCGMRGLKWFVFCQKWTDLVQFWDSYKACIIPYSRICKAMYISDVHIHFL